jgi:hypothetical protein
MLPLLPTQTVDRFNNLFVTAYVTPGNARFLLLHDGKSDDAIRGFFTEVQELYLRVSRLDISLCCASAHLYAAAKLAGRTAQQWRA